MSQEKNRDIGFNWKEPSRGYRFGPTWIAYDDLYDVGRAGCPNNTAFHSIQKIHLFYKYGGEPRNKNVRKITWNAELGMMLLLKVLASALVEFLSRI